MPTTRTDVSEILHTMTRELPQLKDSIEVNSRHWFKRWFFPSSISMLSLIPDSKYADTLNTCEQFEKAYEKAWFFQKWFFPFLNWFNKGTTMAHYGSIKKLGLLKMLREKKDLKLHENHTPLHLVVLSETDLLRANPSQTQKNAEMMCQFPNDFLLSEVLVNLYEYAPKLLQGQAAQENFQKIVDYYQCQLEKHPLYEINKIHAALYVLSKNKLLSGEQAQSNFNALFLNDANKILDAAYSIVNLSKNGFLTDPNTDFFLTHSTELFPGVMTALSKTSLLKGENTKQNYQKIVDRPDLVWTLLDWIDNTLLFTGESAQQNFDAIYAHPYTYSSDIIRKVLPADIFQNNFIQLNQYAEILFGSKKENDVWLSMSRRGTPLTQEQFDAIIRICEKNQTSPEKGRPEFVAYVNQHILKEPTQKSLQADPDLPQDNRFFGSKSPVDKVVPNMPMRQTY